MPILNLKIISARSPYQIVITDANLLESKVELFIYNKGTTLPTIPTYIMSEVIPSVTQRETNYNISPFILEYIDKYKIKYTPNTVVEADNKEWCIVRVKRYKSTAKDEFTLIDTIDYVGVNAFTQVRDGVNFDIAVEENNHCLLANEKITARWNAILPFYNFIVSKQDKQISAQYFDKNDSLVGDITFYNPDTQLDDYYNFAISLVKNNSVYIKINVNDVNFYKIQTEDVLECKYPVKRFWFVNHYGGWNHYVFYKASADSIQVKASEYNLMQKDVTYDYRRGQKKPFNINGNGTLKVNTGWVTEDNFELLQDMLLSDTIVLDAGEIPMTIKTTSLDKKTYLKDKNINYTVEFDYANNLINNIV